MARILYGLCSVGIGHAVRSKVVLDHLKKTHDLFIVASHQAYDYLHQYYPSHVHTIEGFELAFRNNKVLSMATLVKNALKFSSDTYTHFKNTAHKLAAFNPNIVISDWETFTSYYAKKHHLPLISIDNGHYVRFGNYPFPFQHPFHYLKAVALLYSLVRHADAYMIMRFPGQRLTQRANTYAVDPIIRDDVRKTRPQRKNYILVYQSTKTYEKLLTILKHVNHSFIIYGFDKEGTEGNLTFKRFTSSKDFVRDLAHAKAVITNGGFTLISEALYLHKPLLIVPIKKHFEQYINAQYVHDRGYGVMHADLTTANVEHFITHLYTYTTRMALWSNTKLFATLEKLIRRLTMRHT